VYVAGPIVTRISEISEESESFRAKFHVTFVWEVAHGERDSIPALQARVKARADAKDEEDEKCDREKDEKRKNREDEPWKPQWAPTVRFANEVTRHTFEWQSSWCGDAFEVIDVDVPITGDRGWEVKTMFKAKLACDITFSEDFELQGHPFDCQDLSIVMEGAISIHPPRDAMGQPQLRHFVFVPMSYLAELSPAVRYVSELPRVDPRYSPISDAWKLVGLAVQFGDAPEKHSSTRVERAEELSTENAPQCVLSIKLKRNWRVVMWNQWMIIFALAIATLFTFAIDADELASRLSTVMALMLAALVFDTKTPPRPYRTIMDNYLLAIFAFQFWVMAISVIAFERAAKVDECSRVLSCILLGAIHVCFLCAAYGTVHNEQKKVNMGFNAVHEYLKTMNHAPRVAIQIEPKNRDAKYCGTRKSQARDTYIRQRLFHGKTFDTGYSDDVQCCSCWSKW